MYGFGLLVAAVFGFAAGALVGRANRKKLESVIASFNGGAVKAPTAPPVVPKAPPAV